MVEKEEKKSCCLLLDNFQFTFIEISILWSSSSLIGYVIVLALIIFQILSHQLYLLSFFIHVVVISLVSGGPRISWPNQ